MTSPEKSIDDLCKALQSSILSTDQQWKDIAHPLRSIIEMLKAWGRVMKHLDQPDEATVREVAEGLDRLEDCLFELVEWLEDQVSDFALMLHPGIVRAQETYWTPANKAALILYLRRCNGQDNTDDLDIETWCEEQRITVGRNIVRFASALDRALHDAERERRDHE